MTGREQKGSRQNGSRKGIDGSGSLFPGETSPMREVDDEEDLLKPSLASAGDQPAATAPATPAQQPDGDPSAAMRSAGSPGDDEDDLFPLVNPWVLAALTIPYGLPASGLFLGFNAEHVKRADDLTPSALCTAFGGALLVAATWGWLRAGPWQGLNLSAGYAALRPLSLAIAVCIAWRQRGAFRTHLRNYPMEVAAPVTLRMHGFGLCSCLLELLLGGLFAWLFRR
jgi:hypothetical protein